MGVRQLAELQELESIIQKETYHVLPIMESRQGFTNLAANVQRISQVSFASFGTCTANRSRRSSGPDRVFASRATLLIHRVTSGGRRLDAQCLN